MKVKCGVYDNLRISLTVGKLNQKLNNAKKQELKLQKKYLKKEICLGLEYIEKRLKELG